MAKEVNKKKIGAPSKDSITKVNISYIVGEKINGEMSFTNGETVKMADLLNAKVGEYITITAITTESKNKDNEKEEEK